ncbi:MAG: TIGR04255 family protein [Alicyclobacillus sp.]|nr:TIGR04255 family protein [Alicyclobacillus sp.]
MGRKYSNPPIAQVVCEFRFVPQTEWDMTIPGLVYAELKNTFKTKRQIHAIETGTTSSGNTIQQQFGIVERTQFLTEDEIVSIQVSPNYLSVTHLKPYRTWDEFSPFIQQALKAYVDVVNPSSFQRIGLRYINHIEFNSQLVKLEDYFNFYPFVGDKLPQTHVSFLCGAHFQYNDGRDLLRAQLMSGLSDKPDSVAITLDLDYFLGRPMPVVFQTAMSWITGAHDTIEETFEGCIKDSLREMFDEGESN